MKPKTVKWLEILAESINYIIINYALSNMAMLFQSSPLFILFFASEIWVMNNYLRKVCELSKHKIVSTIFMIVCFAIHIGLIYFVGCVAGNIIPFKQ